VLAGFYDGQAGSGPSAGPATLAGLKIAREHDWRAPDFDRHDETTRSGVSRIDQASSRAEAAAAGERVESGAGERPGIVGGAVQAVQAVEGAVEAVGHWIGDHLPGHRDGHSDGNRSGDGPQRSDEGNR